MKNYIKLLYYAALTCLFSNMASAVQWIASGLAKVCMFFSKRGEAVIESDDRMRQLRRKFDFEDAIQQQNKL